jgi:small subunit ribosomal protein S2
MCDTNSNPELVDYPIPANDDAYKSIAVIVKAISQAIEEGLSERKQDKDDG